MGLGTAGEQDENTPAAPRLHRVRADRRRRSPRPRRPEKKKYRYDEIVVLFTSVEQGDDDEVAKKAIEGTKEFLGKLKVNRIIIYPYAHLSQNLARPKDALEVLKAMERYAKEAGLETYRAPFGWNKAFQIKVKGHPLAEQSRVYSPAGRQTAAGRQRSRREGLGREERRR